MNEYYKFFIRDEIIFETWRIKEINELAAYRFAEIHDTAFRVEYEIDYSKIDSNK